MRAPRSRPSGRSATPGRTYFYLALGDLSYGGTEAAWCDLVKSQLGGAFPVQIISGNHDEGTIGRFTSCLPDHLGSRDGPYGQRYFFDYPEQGPLARFILISPDLNLPGPGLSDFSAGSEGARWPSATIADARANGIIWIVVGMHKVCISAGVKACEIGVDLLNQLVNERVDLVLQAHDHSDQRSRQLALGPGCPVNWSGTHVPACVADDGADGSYAKGAGALLVIQGTFGRPLYQIRSSDPEVGYFARLMGANLQPSMGSSGTT